MAIVGSIAMHSNNKCTTIYLTLFCKYIKYIFLNSDVFLSYSIYIETKNTMQLKYYKKQKSYKLKYWYLCFSIKKEK